VQYTEIPVIKLWKMLYACSALLAMERITRMCMCAIYKEKGMRGGNRSEWKNNIVPKWVCEMVAA
jgi:hypothetical protein